MRTTVRKRSLTYTTRILSHYANGSGQRDGEAGTLIQRLLIDTMYLLQHKQVEKPLAEITRLLHVAEDMYLRASAPPRELAKIRQFREAAKDTYASEDIEFDDLAPVSMSEHGAFVQAWVWVSEGEIENQTTNAHDHCCRDCGVSLNDQCLDPECRETTDHGGDLTCQDCGGETNEPSPFQKQAHVVREFFNEFRDALENDEPINGCDVVDALHAFYEDYKAVS